MLSFVRRFVQEEEGATMLEYALMVAFIALALVVVVSTLGQAVGGTFHEVNELMAWL